LRACSLAGLLACHTEFETFLVYGTGVPLQFAFLLRQLGAGRSVESAFAALSVAGSLETPASWRRTLGSVDSDRIAGTRLIH
jgi:hypothetical protein